MINRRICVIGSGPCGAATCEELLKLNYEVTLVDFNPNFNDYKDIKINKKSIKISPKYNSKNFIVGNRLFQKFNNLSSKNFFISSVLSLGGLSNYWGGGLEIPKKKFFKNFYECFNFYDYFNSEKKNFNLKNIYSPKIELSNNFKFHNPLILSQDLSISEKKFFKNYLNNKYIYNSKYKIEEMEKKNKLKFYDNLFVNNISRINDSYQIVCLDKNLNSLKLEEKFKCVYICTGAIGSRILVNKIKNIDNKSSFKLYHTPMAKLLFIKFPFVKININHMYEISNKLKFSKGYMLQLNKINYKSSNIFINFLLMLFKNFIVVGTLFYHQSCIDTYFSYDKKNKNYKISFKTKKRFKIIKKYINKQLNIFSRKYFLIKIPLLSIQDNKFGSDAHYTSTLYNSELLSKENEVINYKNIFVNDTSVIKPGLFYPTFLSMYYSRFMVKIKNK